MPNEALSATDMLVLDAERLHWRYAGTKLGKIRTLGLTETGYYQRLNRLLDDPRAAAYAPTVITRLRRARESRQGRSPAARPRPRA